MLKRSLLLCAFSVLGLTSCAHPNRISRGALQRLTKKGAPYVLVFGSLSTPDGAIPAPTIRFSHQVSWWAPEHLLRSLTISNGDRFYAILEPPNTPDYTLPYLDEFYVEVGSANSGFDRVDFVRLHKTEEPQAMYVGEIEMTPAPDRTAQGQAIRVKVRDSYRQATQELKRLYPRFRGVVGKALSAGKY